MSTKYLKANRWTLLNLSTQEIYTSKYSNEDGDITLNRGSVYTEKFALNREKGIIQFLHGTSDTLSLTERLRSTTFSDETSNRIAVLSRMATRDSNKGQPPILSFQLGDGHLSMICIIDGQISIKYDQASRFSGKAMGATVSFTLRQYTPFEHSVDQSFETRYHVSKTGDYHALLAAIEWGDPMLGIALMHRQPDFRPLKPGTIIKLPTIEGMRQDSTEHTSHVLKSLGRSSPQRSRMRRAMEASSVAFIKSEIIDA